MFDWHSMVAERLLAMRLAPDRRNEVVAEIAGHLEEAYQTCLERGLNEDEARPLVLSEVRSWEEFAHDICEATEDEMTDRVKALWLPGAACVLAAVLLERMFYVLAARAWTVHLGPYGAFTLRGSILINPVFLVCLPACGAIAAWLARRSGASFNLTIVAATFPALLMAASMFVTAILGVIVGLINPGYLQPIPLLEGLVIYFLGFVILPGVSLVLGALPFLGSREKEHTLAA
jgi:hypothetical protein